MPTSSSSSQQALEALGLRLREIRLLAGLTGRSLSARAVWLPSKVSKIEHGKQAPSHDDIRVWCRVCGVPEQIPELIACLQAVEGMFVEWRRMERTGLKMAQESVKTLFERTKHFRAYSAWNIPGLFQTAAYTKAVLSTLVQRRGLIDDSDEAVQVRMERAQVLTKGNHRFAVVVEESVLLNKLGGAEVMVEQMHHLIVLASLSRVSFGVIPQHADRTAMWPVESFWMYDEGRVQVELVSGWLNITQAHELAAYSQAFADLAAIAVYGSQARELMIRATRTY
ncbi:helix-turn-helix transcriptional regulator [Catellatospora sp. NPDC049111]|uniref:helix-turn-helix domain-containing protein n=1 Tax=Catellatospora sp. NPDC049111 TaxID=3155271 RepID=UPI00340F92AD